MGDNALSMSRVYCLGWGTMVIIVSFGYSFDYLGDDLSPRERGVVVFDGLCVLSYYGMCKL